MAAVTDGNRCSFVVDATLSPAVAAAERQNRSTSMPTIGFIANAEEHLLVTSWMESRGVPATITRSQNKIILHFHEEGPVSFWPDPVPVPSTASSGHQLKRAFIARTRQQESPGEPIPNWDESPIAVITEPRALRGVLRTVGEVTFTATNLPKRFPRLAKLYREMRGWLREQEHVFGPSLRESEHAYYLEAGILNRDIDIYAFPQAFAALRAGQYFVPDDASEGTLVSLCQRLRLRDVHCLGSY